MREEVVNLLTNGERGDWYGSWSTDVAGKQGGCHLHKEPLAWITMWSQPVLTGFLCSR